MPTINQLPSASSLSSSDQLPVYSSSNGDARKASLSTLLAWFRSTFADPEFTTVLEAPTGSGFNIQLAASTESIWLIANPTGAFAAGTITLPPVADCFDGQEIIVTCSQSVTALTVDGNGATVLGEPSALGTGGFFALRFRESQATWYTTSQSLGALGTVNDTLTLASSGSDVTLLASGAAANISISLTPKGTGSVDCGSAAVTAGEFEAPSAVIDNVNVDIAILQTPTTVAGLGGAAPSGKRRFVTDANATTFHSIVAGGGSNNVPVYSDGTNWRIG